jgi:5-carboxymethyl-2-hydroxymuconic-semialdehyde dehydrogenase
MDKVTPKSADAFQVNKDRAAPLLAKLKTEGIGHIIDGKIVPSISGEAFETKSPVDGAVVLASVARGNAEDIDRAATSAAQAFRAWRDMPAAMRKKLLHRVADAIEDRADDIAVLECIDTGQAHRFMAKAAIRAAENFRFFADKCADARDGLNMPSDEHWNVSTRVPIGPVGVITPWNTPFMLSTWKIAPALAAGCTVVHKPAEWSPVTADLLAKLVKQAGVPDGVLNTVHGFGEEAGKALTEHPAIKAIGFVGESATGSAIMAQGAPTLKRVHFELGGKNPVIVFNDADLDRALDAVVFMIYSLNGERCTSSSRLLVQHGIAEQFIEKLTARVKALKVGHPLDPATEIGPLIHERHLAKVCSYFEIARKDGAVIAVGGKPHDGPGGGHYVQPTLVTGARADMRVALEESVRAVPDGHSVQGRKRGGCDRQRRAIRPHRLCLDRRHGPRLTRRGCAGGRHDLVELRKRPASANPVWRHEILRHRPRRRRLFVRLLHGNQAHLARARYPQDSEAGNLIFVRHSGARSSREPGIQSSAWCWIPGLRPKRAHPGMTTVIYADPLGNARCPFRPTSSIRHSTSSGRAMPCST